ncbi:hypothetical protein GGP91_002962, partial [Salinibacter ruber]|nr:hypothetical protein [Salinibacter ruber]
MNTSPNSTPERSASENSTSLLPEDFQFSQGSLQDFDDCPRRFLLRHIEGRP